MYYEPAFPLLLETLTELLGGVGGEDKGGAGGEDGGGEGKDGREGREQVCYFCMKKRRKADMRFVGALKRQFEVEEVVKGVVEGEKGVFLYGSTTLGRDFWTFSLMVADVGTKCAGKSEDGCREGGMDADKA